MTRKTWPLLLGSFVVATTLIAACNNSSDEGDDDDGTSAGGTQGTNTLPGNGGSGNTGNNSVVNARGGASNAAVGGNRFGSNTNTLPAQGSTTARGGQTGAGGVTGNGGAKAGGAAGKGGSATAGTKATAGNAGRAGAAGGTGKAGSSGNTGVGGSSITVAGNAGQGQGGSKATAGASGSSTTATGGASTGGVSGIAGNSGVAGAGNTAVTCTDGCAGLTVPAGGSAEFAIGLSSVALTGTSSVSLTYFSNNAGAGTVQLVLYGTGATPCPGDTFNLISAASGYTTVTADFSACALAGVTNAIAVGLVIANGAGASPVVVNVETLALQNTTPAVAAWTFADASSISASFTATAGKLYPKGTGGGSIAFVATGG